MGTHLSTGPTGTPRRGLVWLGVMLLGIGLLGHLLAAHGTGGRALDYRHHVGGFVMLSLLSGVVVAGLGWYFWRGRHDITLLIVGALQALVGLVIYLERFRIAVAW